MFLLYKKIIESLVSNDQPRKDDLSKKLLTFTQLKSGNSQIPDAENCEPAHPKGNWGVSKHKRQARNSTVQMHENNNGKYGCRNG